MAVHRCSFRVLALVASGTPCFLCFLRSTFVHYACLLVGITSDPPHTSMFFPNLLIGEQSSRPIFGKKVAY